MEKLEEQIPLNQKVEELVEFNMNKKYYNPGLRALLSVKHFSATLEKDYAELLKIESELSNLNLKAQLIIEANTTPEAMNDWKLAITEINNAIMDINTVLTSAKEKIAHDEKDSYPEFWKLFTLPLTELKNNCENATNVGLTLLTESIHKQWENDYVTLQAPLVDSLLTYVESCRILLQMIDRYTPDELNAITQIIADHVPLNFTYEEALDYQKDYYKELLNFKKEFKQEKNLWDKFLDILAGGTHQSPSERVMFDRWIDGEKGDL
jgi:hypothetical protein